MADLTMLALLLADSRLEIQLTLLAMWAILWYSLIKFGSEKLVRPYILAQPWKQQWTLLYQKMMKNTYMVDMDVDSTFEMCTELQCVCFQHMFGGMLCLPSALGLQGAVVSAMACHGALCEASWELQDLLAKLYQITLGGRAGKARNPPALLAMILLHHAMGLSMVLPMNMMYGLNPHYHEFVFLLQGAAATALLSQSYGFTLDVNTADGLMSMKGSVTFTMITILYTRLLRYVYLGYQLAMTFYADGNIKVMCGGIAMLILLGIVNILMCVDAVKKCMKFLSMKPRSHTSLPQERIQCMPAPRNCLLATPSAQRDMLGQKTTKCN